MTLLSLLKALTLAFFLYVDDTIIMGNDIDD